MLTGLAHSTHFFFFNAEVFLKDIHVCVCETQSVCGVCVSVCVCVCLCCMCVRVCVHVFLKKVTAQSQ